MANIEVVSEPVIQSVVITLRPVEAAILVTVFEQYMGAADRGYIRTGAYDMTVPAWIEELRAQGVEGAQDDDF